MEPKSTHNIQPNRKFTCKNRGLEQSKNFSYRDVRISGVSLGVGGGEDGVDQNEGADDLGAEAAAFGVASGDEVSAAELLLVDGFLKTLHDAGAADCA